jgi:hypothetical protein
MMWQWIEVSGKLYALASLYPEKEQMILLREEAGLAPKLI